MNEQIPGDTPIEDPKAWTEQEQEDQLARYLAEHPDKENPFRESSPEIAELDAMFGAFETKHSLSELLAIEALDPLDAPNHPIREPARLDLIPIVAKLNVLETETDISTEKLTELKATYKKISQAVGMINKGKVDHTR